jgi:hypothetical protein
MNNLKETATVIALLLGILAQLFVAAKTIYAGERVIKDLSDFKQSYEKHLEDYYELVSRVSFIEGRMNV